MRTRSLSRWLPTPRRTRFSLLLIVVGILASIALAACGDGATSTPAPSPTDTPAATAVPPTATVSPLEPAATSTAPEPTPVDVSLQIALNEQNDSGQSGWATLTAQGEQTVVVLDLSAGTVETEAVHIHEGACGDALGSVVHPLKSFVDGNGGSVTRVDASLDTLQSGGFAINSHKKGEPAVYTSCGNIPVTADSVTIAMDAQNDSGQSGWATLTSRGEQTEVVLSLGAGDLQTEAVHIHEGSCGDLLGSVAHPLSSFVGGLGGSVSMVDATLASLRTGGFAVNSHKAGEPAVYTSCGNIPSGQAQALNMALNAQNDSGQSGWATLTAQGEQTVVVLDLSAGTVETEAVHIHEGACGDALGSVVHPLKSFVDGNGGSVTRVDASLDALQSGGFAINSHKKGEPAVYTSCGNIPVTADSVTIAMDAQNDSGQSGWATLTSRGEQTEVVLSLGAGDLQTEAVHIHEGSCGDLLGSVAHPLSSFVGGLGGSVSLVDATLASLRTGGFAVNSHKVGEPAVYTSCGNIPETTLAAADEETTAAATIVDFSHEDLTVNVGTTVVWTNEDGAPHTTTSDDGLWDSSVLGTGETFSFTFDQAGAFNYVCTIHPSMTAVITVS